MERGELSYSKVRELTRVADAATDLGLLNVRDPQPERERRRAAAVRYVLHLDAGDYLE